MTFHEIMIYPTGDEYNLLQMISSSIFLHFPGFRNPQDSEGWDRAVAGRCRVDFAAQWSREPSPRACCWQCLAGGQSSSLLDLSPVVFLYESV